MNVADQQAKERVRAALQVVFALAEAIRERKQVPSGELYAVVMGKLSLEAYRAAIDQLKRAELVTESASHLLTWVGPQPERSAS